MVNTFIEPKELAETPPSSCVIIDCRFSLADFTLGKKQYLDGHIPGAFHLDTEEDLSGIKAPHGGRHPLPSKKDFEETLRKCGVNQNSTIVVYDDNRMAGCARLWWLLQYFGHQKVRILNGGIRAWLQQGRPITKDLPSTSQGDFVASENHFGTVNREWLLHRLNSKDIQIIDAREAFRYNGESEPIDPLAGHIPGAINIPWLDAVDEKGKWCGLHAESLETLDRKKPSIVYCGSGVTASVIYLALKEARFEDLYLYPGSWSDWCSYKSCPIEPDTEL